MAVSATELIRYLNESDEHTDIEAKAASDVGRSLMETVCAFANEPRMGGGYIVCGVKEVTDRVFRTYEVVGVENPNKFQEDVSSQARSVFNRPVQVQTFVESVNGKNVVVIHVPEANPHEKPIYFRAMSLPRGAIRRIGPSDVSCTDDDLQVLYNERRPGTHDVEPLPNADLSDIDPNALHLYRMERRAVKPDAQELHLNDEDLLLALGAAVRESGRLVPTVCGILLFGTFVAQRRFFPTCRVDYLRVSGTEWVEDPENRFNCVEITGPLVSVIRRAVAAVLDDLPKAFSLPANEIQGRELPLIPSAVIREAIVKAVMHRNYRAHGSVLVIRYSNRLEIQNPGASLKAAERFLEPGSEPRNPRLAAVLHDLELAEVKGTGMQAMSRIMRQSGLEPPHFESDREGDRFVTRMLFHHFLGSEDINWLSRFSDLDLSCDDHRALLWAREAGAVDNSIYRSFSGLDTLSASRRLRVLCNHGLLEQHGKSTATHYKPSNLLLEGPPDSAQPAIEASLNDKLPALSDKVGGLNDKLPALSDKVGGLNDKLPALSDKLTNECQSHSENEVPAELRDKLSRIGHRGKPIEIERLILELCELRPMRAAELARHLSRKSIRSLTNRYLARMVNRGLLEMTMPDQPSHPNQAYQISDVASKELLSMSQSISTNSILT